MGGRSGGVRRAVMWPACCLPCPLQHSCSLAVPPAVAGAAVAQHRAVAARVSVWGCLRACVHVCRMQPVASDRAVPRPSSHLSCRPQPVLHLGDETLGSAFAPDKHVIKDSVHPNTDPLDSYFGF